MGRDDLVVVVEAFFLLGDQPVLAIRRPQHLFLRRSHIGLRLLERAHREDGLLPLEVLAVTGGAGGADPSPHQRFEFIAAAAALVVVEWHPSRLPASRVPAYN